MNTSVTIYEAKTHLSKYIKQAKAGHPVYIGSYGQQEVVLMAAKPRKPRIRFGAAAGKLQYKPGSVGEPDADIQLLFYENRT